MSLTTSALLNLGLLVVALALLRALVIQIRQRAALRDWLDDPEARDVPEGHGPWHEIFSRLQRFRRDQQRRQATLDGGLERFRQAAQALPDGIVLLDGEGRIEWLNKAASESFGLDPQRDLGTLIEQLFRDRRFHDFLTRFRAGEAPESLTLGLDGANGTQVYLLQLLSFSVAGTLLLSRNITETLRVEAVRRDFIADVSHELRTPLTVISGFLEQLTDEPPPAKEESRRFMQLMSEQAARMIRLVEDLLTLSRLETDSAPPREETVDVPALVETLRAEAIALSGNQHLIEVTEISVGGVVGSGDELRSAFGNLVSNAIRYTPAGGRVSLAWRLEQGLPVFSVSDTGPGIPQPHLQRLTERFYRVDKGRSTATGGTGLGLAIVKHVLARHQGALMVRSEVGHGSVFSARLPRERLIREPLQGSN